MQNGTTGAFQYYSTNTSRVFQFAIGNLTWGGTISVKAGVYNIDSTILLNKIGLKILGETWGINNYGVVLNLTTSGIPLFNVTGTNPLHSWFVSIEDMELRGNNLANSVGVLIAGDTYTSDVIMDHIFINGFTYGLKVSALTQKVWNIWLRDSLIEANTKAGIYFTGTSSVLGNMIDRVTIESNHFASNFNSLYCDTPYVYNILFTENSVELETQSSINVTNGKNWIITDNRINDCGTSVVNTFGSIFVNGTMLPESGQWPQGWRISDNILQNHFTDNMNYSIWLTGKIADFNVHDNNVANIATSFRTDGLTGYGNNFHDNSPYNVSPEDSSGSESIRISTDGTYYYSVNCTSNMVMERSTNASKVINFLFGNMSLGGSAFVKKGDYPITYVQDVPSNVKLYSDGARLYLPSGQPNDDQHHEIFRVNGKQNVTISGFTFDGNLGVTDSSVSGAAIIVTGASAHVTIEENTFENWRNFGVYVLAYGTTISDITTRRNHFLYGGMWNPVAYNSASSGILRDSTVSENYIEYFDEFGIAFSTASSTIQFCTAWGNHISFSGNGTYGHDWLGIACGINFEGCTDCEAYGNTISNVNVGVNFDSNSVRNKLYGNTITTNTTVAISGRNASNGVWIYGVSNEVYGNTVNVGFNEFGGNIGIYDLGSNTTISCNNINRIGSHSSLAGIALQEGSSSDIVMIFGNRFTFFSTDIDNWGSGTIRKHDNLGSAGSWLSES
jgi:hypothetical protein